MFEFTTLSVYNNISVATPDEIKAGAKGYNVINNASGTSNPYIRIGNTRFDKGLIVKFDVRNPSKECLAKVTFDLSEVSAKMPECDNEMTGRIGLYIGLSMNSLDSFYANDFVYKGKPFFIEFPVKRDLTNIAASVKKIIDKYMLLMTDEKILNVTVDSKDANGNTIIIQGVNGYQLIRKAVLQWFNPEAKSVDCCTNQGDYETIITGVPVMWTIAAQDDSNNGIEAGDAVPVTAGEGNSAKVQVYDGAQGRNLADNEVAILPGLEAFGDYNWIIHNLRLPTLANTHFWSPTKNEMPIPGQLYTQFTITMRDTNKGTAGNDIGQVTTCQTTHVLYVVGNVDTTALASNQDTGAQLVFGLLKALTNAQVTPEDKINNTADTKFNAPFEN